MRQAGCVQCSSSSGYFQPMVGLLGHASLGHHGASVLGSVRFPLVNYKFPRTPVAALKEQFFCPWQQIPSEGFWFLVCFCYAQLQLLSFEKMSTRHPNPSMLLSTLACQMSCPTNVVGPDTSSPKFSSTAESSAFAPGGHDAASERVLRAVHPTTQDTNACLHSTPSRIQS